MPKFPDKHSFRLYGNFVVMPDNLEEYQVIGHFMIYKSTKHDRCYTFYDELMNNYRTVIYDGKPDEFISNMELYLQHYEKIAEEIRAKQELDDQTEYQ